VIGSKEFAAKGDPAINPRRAAALPSGSGADQPSLAPDNSSNMTGRAVANRSELPETIAASRV
jgi:hypothetical protein